MQISGDSISSGPISSAMDVTPGVLHDKVTATVVQESEPETTVVVDFCPKAEVTC